MLTASQRRSAFLANQVTLSISSTKTTGVAPCGIHFSGVATTASGTTHPATDLHWKWEFSDDGNTYTTDGRSKDVEYGIVVAHTFETPGVKTITCTVSNGHGSWSESMQVTIEDPNVVFSGSNTICFSTSGNFTGKPSGAQEVTISTKIIESCDPSTNRLTITNHQMVTGEYVYLENGGGTLPTSTGAYATPTGTSRYVRVVDSNTITLHGSQYGFVTGDHIVDFTSNGTGQIRRGIGSIITGYLRDGKRCLLRGGETFESYTTGEFYDYLSSVDVAQIGSFGVGKATVKSYAGSNLITLPTNNTATSITIMDLILDNNNQSCLGITGVAKRWNGLTILRINGLDSAGGDFSRCLVLNGVQFNNQDTVIQDCQLTDSVYQLFATGEYFSVLGNLMTHTYAGGSPEHNMRITWIDKGLISHNRLIDGGSTKTIFRIQGSGASGEPSRYVTVNLNTFINSSIPLAWPCMFGSSDSAASSNMNDIVCENNFFDLQNWIGPYAMTVYCTDSVFRNNVFRLMGNVSGAVFSMNGHPGVPTDDAPANLRFEHNSVYCAATSGTMILVDLNRDDTRVAQQGVSDNIKIYNNILVGPNGVAVSQVSNPDLATNVTTSNNLVQTSYLGWATQPPITVADFELTSISSAVDAGTDSAAAISDYHNYSWMNAERDVGALRSIKLFSAT